MCVRVRAKRETHRRKNNEVVRMGVAMRFKWVVVNEITPVDVIGFECVFDHTHFPAQFPIENSQ